MTPEQRARRLTLNGACAGMGLALAVSIGLAAWLDFIEDDLRPGWVAFYLIGAAIAGMLIALSAPRYTWRLFRGRP